MRQEKIVLFGAGQKKDEIIGLVERYGGFELVEIWDNNRLLWGESVRVGGLAVTITGPHRMEGPKIVISTDVYFKEIQEQLIRELAIRPEQIKPRNYVYKDLKKAVLAKYKESKEEALAGICAYLQEHEIDMFNGQVKREYAREGFDIFLDEKRGLLYSHWKGKRMYLSSDIRSEQAAKEYLVRLCREQDEESPHSYQLDRLDLNERDVVIDGGAAEGFFALQIVDRVGKLYLLEGDRKWQEALSYTFEPYKDKAVILPKWLGRNNNEQEISIDQIHKQDRVSVVKLDIEGAEWDAMMGGEETFATAQEMKVIVCTYHRTEDAEKFQNYFKEKDYQVEFSKGYLFAEGLEFIKPELRKGVMFASKG